MIMKILFTILIMGWFTICAFSQTPQKMSFQAVIRNGDNKLVAGHAVGIRLSILKGSETGMAVNPWHLGWSSA